MRNFSKLNIDLRGHTSGHVKTFCPFCHEQRHDKRDKSLSVDIDKGLYKCHYCDAQGYVPDEDEERRKEERRQRREKKQNQLPQKGTHHRPDWHPEFLIRNCINQTDAQPLINYLTNTRKLTIETLQQARISLPYIQMDKVFGASSNATEKVFEAKPTVFCSTDDVLSQKAAIDGGDCREARLPAGSVSNGDSGDSHTPSGEGFSGFCQNKSLARVIAFNYFDHNILINTKFRTLSKDFRLVPKAELIPYNVDAILRKEICYITEGEFDCLTLVQCGFPETISVPNGAQKNLSWMDRFVETHFDDKTRIVLALDNDEKGRMLKDELLRRLGEERCRLVTWSDDCKDANEELCKHGAESLKLRVESAAEIPLSGIQTVEDVESSLDELFQNGKQHGAEMQLGGMDRLITFETGRYMVATGRPGDGKSEFVDEICLRLCLLHGWKVAYFSPENTPITYHLAKLIEKLTGYAFQHRGKMTWELYGGCKRWISENICHVLPGTDIDPTIDEFNADYQHAVEDKTDRYTLPAILEKARQAISRRGVRILVIDPLNNIEPDSGMEDLKWDRKVNAELRRFARKYHCLVILVAHPRKVNRANLDGKKRRVEMNDINGSADFGNMTDFCISVDRDDDLKVVSIYVDKVKFKHLGTRGVFYFHYDELSGRYVPCELERVPKGIEIDEGPVHGRPGTLCVRNAIGVKFYKTTDWRNFNIRWVNELGEPTLPDLLDRSGSNGLNCSSGSSSSSGFPQDLFGQT